MTRPLPTTIRTAPKGCTDMSNDNWTPDPQRDLYNPQTPGPYTAPTPPPAPKKRHPGRVVLVVLLGTVGLVAALAQCVPNNEAADITPVISPTPKAAKPSGEQTPPPAKPSMTKAQEQAVSAAENYLSFKAFSRKGLIRQLSSDAGDGYSVADATYAVDHIKVDWNDQAAKAAREYLKMMPFSRQGLIEQLESDAGDGFTHRQAVYGVSKAGL